MGRKRLPRISIACATCGKQFDALPCSHRKYCSHKCAYASHERVKHTELQRKDYGTAKCQECGKEFNLDGQSGLGKYCSHTCSGRHQGRISIDVIRHINRPPLTSSIVPCAACGKLFRKFKSSKRRFCCLSCAAPDRSKNAALTMHKNGHYKSYNGFSRCKSGWAVIGYQRCFFRSSWEKVYAEWLEANIANNQGVIDWQYEPTKFDFPDGAGALSYTPDFMVTMADGSIEYHEVKGWMTEASKKKIALMAAHFPDIKLVLIGEPWFRTRPLDRWFLPTLTHVKIKPLEESIK